jgi:sugar/nucleoside kinase (ribokinase family)
MSLEFVQAAATRGKIALDAQGLVRQVDGGVIRAVRPAELSAFLRTVLLLKVDESEAATLSLRSDANASARILYELGPDEVILTCGSRGSLIFDGARSYAIDAAAGELVDATGCGDTYLAAYLSRRLASDEPERAGHFAATAAAMALERVGAFRASEAEVRDRMV